MAQQATKLVVLAAGRGTRMRRGASTAGLSSQQQAVARTGVKALVPVGRPFLDYVLNRAADAGITEVCLVVGADSRAIQEYYSALRCKRLDISFAVQSQPLGTAHALACAEPFADNKPFLLINSDNCYPVSALRALRELAQPGTVGFEPASLAQRSNLTLDRIRGFAIMKQGEDGLLKQIAEKPSAGQVRQLDEDTLVSMNCWRFSSLVFESCRAIRKSARGEYEIPDAVNHTIRVLREPYRLLRSDEPVLDLSSPSDIGAVEKQLQGEDVRL